MSAVRLKVKSGQVVPEGEYEIRAVTFDKVGPMRFEVYWNGFHEIAHDITEWVEWTSVDRRMT